MAIKYFSNIDIAGSLTFTQSSAAFINHNVTSQSVKFRLSNSSALDVTPFEITPGYMSSTVDMYFGDNDKIRLGASSDLQLYHNGTHSYIRDVGTGSLYLQTNGAAIYLQDTDGNAMAQFTDGGGSFLMYNGALRLSTSSAGITASGNVVASDGSDTATLSATGLVLSRSNSYIQSNADNSDTLNIGQSSVRWGHVKVDGATFKVLNGGTERFGIDSSGNATFAGHVNLAATKKLYFDGGTHTYLTESADNNLQIVTGGTITAQFAGTGLTLRNTQVDGTITVGADDTGYDVKFFGATSGRYLLWYESANALKFTDATKVFFGAGDDLELSHDGNNSWITNATGDLKIYNNADNGDIVFASDDGSGGTTEYLRLDGGTEEVVFSKPIVTAETQIKVLPHHFMSNEDGGVNKSSQFRDDTIIGVRSTADDSELYAFVEIPYGKTATNVTVYGNDTNLAVNVYESDINAGALTDKTPEAGCRVGAVCDITDVAYSATNYLAIKVTTTSYTNDIVYGAVVTII